MNLWTVSCPVSTDLTESLPKHPTYTVFLFSHYPKSRHQGFDLMCVGVPDMFYEVTLTRLL